MIHLKTEYRLSTLCATPVQEYELPTLKRNRLEDAFDEIEILGFSVSCSPFDLLQTKYRSIIMARHLPKYHKRKKKIIANLISRKHVPTKKGTMFFGTWIDA